MLKHRVSIFVFPVLLFLCWYLHNVWAAGLVLVIWILITTIGSFHMRWNYHVVAKHSNKTSEHIAITFDDGPSEFTEKVLDLLSETPHKVTFFLIGNKVDGYPELVRRMLMDGHAVGNHTFTHGKNTGFLNKTDLKEEILKTDFKLKEIIGKRPRFYRPPFGVTNPTLSKVIKETGHIVMGWSIRSLDTKIQNPELIKNRILKKLKAGDGVLLHDTLPQTLEMLPGLLEVLKERGLQSVTLEELHNEMAYR
ncbi:polysaccharide deacetylase [Leadbetterella byssophila DSM 17132]|uniref:Polysaccharide deacetylase n=1 Tax=Leadbetterella byssophila (strain DSM 17132 / JCM 16389 / KACC 11308 / NBRC 106382 / 4M15) TaxID=649349 RepID=E4RX00_LEAB4|nr:polysaccharide deacetylase family protein [Leadbetterella byssophila]ADQ17206.1 polysaccharide deacetylase [Leadbetterella byssophila DSM 17132]